MANPKKDRTARRPRPFYIKGENGETVRLGGIKTPDFTLTRQLGDFTFRNPIPNQDKRPQSGELTTALGNPAYRNTCGFRSKKGAK